MTREWIARSPAHRGLTLSDVEDLEAGGAIAVDWDHGSNGRCGDFRLTPAGEHHVGLLQSPPPTPPVAVTSAWDADVMPLLRAAYELEQGLAPSVGVSQDALNGALGRPLGDQRTSNALI